MAQFEGGFIDQRQSGAFDTGNGSTYAKPTQSNTLRALTIRQFNKGLAAISDATADAIIIDGQETNNLTFVGEVMTVERQTAFVSYRINDGTDEILIKKFTSKDQETLDNPEQEMILLEPHVWAIVYGHPRLLLGETFINVFSIQEIKDHNQITFHFARCIHQHLYFTKGPLPSHSPQSQNLTASAAKRPRGPPTSLSPTATLVDASGDVKVAIQQLLMRTGEMTMADIYNKLDEDFSKKSIRAAIEEMAENGQLYSGSAYDSYAWSG